VVYHIWLIRHDMSTYQHILKQRQAAADKQKATEEKLQREIQEKEEEKRQQQPSQQFEVNIDEKGDISEEKRLELMMKEDKTPTDGIAPLLNKDLPTKEKLSRSEQKPKRKPLLHRICCCLPYNESQPLSEKKE